MTYKVIVDFDENNKITKYQDVDTEEEAIAHVAKVVDNYPNAFYVLDTFQGNMFDYLVVDSVNKTLTPNDTQFAIDETAIEDAKPYDIKRKEAYSSIVDQLDMQYHDIINATTTWVDHIRAVKAAYPKGE
jgi:hypothetical protein